MGECGMQNEPQIFDAISHQVRNWRRFGRLIGVEEFMLDNIELDNDKKYDRLSECLRYKKETAEIPVGWCFLKERLLKFKEGVHIIDALERRFPALLDSVKEQKTDEEADKKYMFLDIFDIISMKLRDWRRFATILDIKEDVFIELEGNEKYKDHLQEKIYRCIDEKNSTPDWFYWRNILHKMDYKDLVEDIEIIYPVLLSDDKIDLADVDHQINDGFTTIISHHADRTENLDHLSVKFNDQLKICIGAGKSKSHSLKKVEEMSKIFDDYFKKYDILNNIKNYDFSNVNESDECEILKTQHLWLKENDDQGFAIKGYDVNAHLKMFSNHVNVNPQKDSILTYSEKHNIFLYINKAKENIKKSMRDNCFNIRPLRTIHKCLNGQSYTYIPITLHNYNKNEVNDIVKCKNCFDLNLIESLETFTNLESLREWWEKIIHQVEEIRSEQNIEAEISDINISNQLFKNILGFIALANFNLPTFTNLPEKEIKEMQKLIMFTPEQQDIIYSKSKRKIIKGSFGSGKTLAAQQLVKLVVLNRNPLDFVYYVIHDNSSIYVKEMKNLAETFKEENVKACTISNLTRNNKSLSAMFQHLIQIHKGDTVHVFMEEFNGEVLDEEEVEKIKELLENTIFKNSHIVLVCQSMESERYLIQNKDRIPYNRYQFTKLSEQAGFKIFDLSYLLRSSQHINNIVDVAVKVLDKTITEFVVPNLDSTNDPQTVDSNIQEDLKNEALASNELTALALVKPIQSTSSSAQDIEQIELPEHSEQTSVDTSDTDKLLKHFTVNSHQYESKMDLESSCTFVGKRKPAQSVCGSKPVVYYLFKEEDKESISYGYQVFCLSKVFKKIKFPRDKNKQIIICMNDESKSIVQDALNVNNIIWTDDPQLLSTTEVHALLTDYTSVRGCEYINVILILPDNEQHLKHHLVGGISRCVLTLRLIVINGGVPDKTLVEIFKTWKDKDLVVINDENYLQKITTKDLEKINELNQLSAMNDIQNKNVDMIKAHVIHKLFRNKQFDNQQSASYLMRSSKYINDIVNVAIPILEEAKIKSTIPNFNSGLSFNSANPTTFSNKRNLNDVLKEDENLIYTSKMTKSRKRKHDESYKQESKMTDSDIITSYDDTSKFLKHCTISADKYSTKREIESNYTIAGERETAHFVNRGKLPVIYFPFNLTGSNVDQIFCLAEVFKAILNDKKEQVIICFNIDSMNMVRNALMVNKVKWTNDPQLLSTSVCLLTDYTTVRGCEFLNVILICPTDEQYLKHNLVDCLSSCIFDLKFIIFNLGIPDDTLVAILQKWINAGLVNVSNEDYLKNADNEKLKRFKEINHDILNSRYQNQNFDINDPKVIQKLKVFGRSSSDNQQLTSTDPSSSVNPTD